jgi:hypothetical protein
MSQSRELEQERRIDMLDRRLRQAEDRVAEALQTLARRFNGGGGVSSDPPHQYLARGDGAAQATGTFPSITKDTFASDVLDVTTGDVVATAVDVEWWYTDPLTVAGALVWCVKKPDGGFVGVLEQCTAIALDP